MDVNKLVVTFQRAMNAPLNTVEGLQPTSCTDKMVSYTAYGLFTALSLGYYHKKYAQPILKARAQDRRVAALRQDLSWAARSNFANGIQQIYHNNRDVCHRVFADDPAVVSPLFYAARHNGRAAAETLIGYGLSADVVDKDGWSPLATAIWVGALDTAQFLMERGANLESCGKDKGMSPLYLAIEGGIRASNEDLYCEPLIGLDIAKELLSRGVSVAKRPTEPMSLLALVQKKFGHYRAQADALLRLLIARGAILDPSDELTDAEYEHFKTLGASLPLRIPAWRDNLAQVSLLIDNIGRESLEPVAPEAPAAEIPGTPVSDTKSPN